MITSAEHPFQKASHIEHCCFAWTESAGRCGLARQINSKTCFIHRDYYEGWWERNPPISNGNWIQGQIDMRDTIEQHMFQLREGHVELGAETQEHIAAYIYSHQRGLRAYMRYYKTLLTLPANIFNPTLCERLLDSYIGILVEDFLYYRFLGRSPTDSLLYVETLFKEVLYSKHVEIGRIFRVLGSVLALLKISPEAGAYLHGSSWLEVTHRTLTLFLRLAQSGSVILNGKTCRDILNVFWNGTCAKALSESSGFSENKVRPLLAEVGDLLTEELWALWRGLAKERSEVIKEELYYFTSHVSWWLTRCVDIDEARDFDESPEELWAIGEKVAGPFYLRSAAAATPESRKKLKTGFWREMEDDA